MLTGNHVASELIRAMLSRRARVLVHPAAVADLQARLCTTLDRSDRAVEVCLAYLRLVGIAWTPHPTDADARHEYEDMQQRLGGRSIDTLLDLPVMSDPGWQATMDVLLALLAPAVFTDKNLHDLAVLRMANLSLEHGNCDA